MTPRLVLRPEAVKDLREAFRWYESQRLGLGRVFLRRIRERIHQIRENPRSFPIVLKSVRRATVVRFPYGIYFEDQGDRILVAAVFHFKRNPAGWMRRSQ